MKLQIAISALSLFIDTNIFFQIIICKGTISIYKHNIFACSVIQSSVTCCPLIDIFTIVN